MLHDIHDELANSHTGYDITSNFRLAFIEFRKTAENTASDDFGSNFSGAAFCLLVFHQLLLSEIVQTCKFMVMFGSRFLDNGSTDSEKIYSFGNCGSRGLFPLMQYIKHFCFLVPKMGLKWAYRRLRITQMADFDFLGN